MRITRQWLIGVLRNLQQEAERIPNPGGDETVVLKCARDTIAKAVTAGYLAPTYAISAQESNEAAFGRLSRTLCKTHPYPNIATGLIAHSLSKKARRSRTDTDWDDADRASFRALWQCYAWMFGKLAEKIAEQGESEIAVPVPGRGKRWQDAMKLAERQCNPWPGKRKLALRCGCSVSTINKALAHSLKLRNARAAAESKTDERSVSDTALSKAVADSLESREAAPDSAESMPTRRDELIDHLLDFFPCNQRKEKRKALQAIDPATLEAMAREYADEPPEEKAYITRRSR